MEEIKNIVLIGNPNTGKTTLFNALTSSHEHIGNWPGVTIEKKEHQIIYNLIKYNIVDLPGTYSLNSFSLEEKVSSDYVFSHQQDIYVVVCDSSNLKRNLYLALQLMELKLAVILAINLFKNKNQEKIEKIIKNRLKMPFFLQNFSKKIDFNKFFNAINQIQNYHIKLNYLKKFNMDRLNLIIKKQTNFSQFTAMRLLEDNDDYLNYSNFSESEIEYFKAIKNSDTLEKLVHARYSYIDEMFEENEITLVNKKLNICDKILLNKYLALPIFLCVMLAVFYLTFSSIGKILSTGLEFLIVEKLGGYISSIFINNDIAWLNSFFTDCLIGGVGSVLVFLPQIILLLTFLNLLEQSGYLSRIAYIFQNALNKIGLEGKSIFTLLLGFGCSATAILTAKNLGSQKSKIKTILLTPFVPCSAKLPVIAVLGGAFFHQDFLIIFLLYIMACIVGVLWACIINRGKLRESEQTFLLEFPRYQNPFNMELLRSIYISTKNFLIKVGVYILAFSIIIWILKSFSFSFGFVQQSGELSILEQIARFIAPVFAPIGLGNWGIIACLFSGLIAKELIVSTLGILNGVSDETQIGASLLLSNSIVYFSTPQLLSFLTFLMLYPPCVATFSVMRNEIGIKNTLCGYGALLGIAFLASYFVYTFALCFNHYGALIGVFTLLAIILIVISILIIFNKKACGRDCINCNVKCGKRKMNRDKY